jgi:hypothetical protein
VGETVYGIGVPVRHANLSVLVIHSTARDESDFLTLDEGLTAGSVAVTEEASAQVNQLCIENRSERPLYVQVGDRLKGGQQDRIVGQSFVVPAKSGRQPIRSFCVEPHRWHAQGGDMAFAAAITSAAAPENVRAAALQVNQGAVWEHVAEEKKRACDTLAAPNATSTLNETLDSEEVQKAARPYQDALGSALQGENDAVGVAFALDGKVVEVDVYPGTVLLRKLYPRLLASVAFQAASSKAPAAGAVAAQDVKRFIEDGAASSTRQEKILGNDCDVIDYDGKIEARTSCGKEHFMSVMKK